MLFHFLTLLHIAFDTKEDSFVFDVYLIAIDTDADIAIMGSHKKSVFLGYFSGFGKFLQIISKKKIPNLRPFASLSLKVVPNLEIY